MEEETALGHARAFWEYGPEARQVIRHMTLWAQASPRGARFRARYVARHLERKHGLEPEVTRDVLWELLGRPGTLPEQM